MQFLPSVKTTCGHCHGSGFAPDVLKITHKSKSIADVLAMNVTEFGAELERRDPTGGSRPGQPAATMTWATCNWGKNSAACPRANCRKLKLLKYLNLEKSDMLFLLDEPSFGLHGYDIAILQKLIGRLLQNRNTVVAVEHNLAMIAGADFVVELGPEGGAAGGHLIFQRQPGQHGAEPKIPDRAISEKIFKKHLTKTYYQIK